MENNDDEEQEDPSLWHRFLGVFKTRVAPTLPPAQAQGLMSFLDALPHDMKVQIIQRMGSLAEIPLHRTSKAFRTALQSIYQGAFRKAYVECKQRLLEWDMRRPTHLGYLMKPLYMLMEHGQHELSLNWFIHSQADTVPHMPLSGELWAELRARCIPKDAQQMLYMVDFFNKRQWPGVRQPIPIAIFQNFWTLTLFLYNRGMRTDAMLDPDKPGFKEAVEVAYFNQRVWEQCLALWFQEDPVDALLWALYTQLGSTYDYRGGKRENGVANFRAYRIGPRAISEAPARLTYRFMEQLHGLPKHPRFPSLLPDFWWPDLDVEEDTDGVWDRFYKESIELRPSSLSLPPPPPYRMSRVHVLYPNLLAFLKDEVQAADSKNKAILHWFQVLSEAFPELLEKKEEQSRNVVEMLASPLSLYSFPVLWALAKRSLRPNKEVAGEVMRYLASLFVAPLDVQEDRQRFLLFRQALQEHVETLNALLNLLVYLPTVRPADRVMEHIQVFFGDRYNTMTHNLSILTTEKAIVDRLPIVSRQDLKTFFAKEKGGGGEKH